MSNVIDFLESLGQDAKLRHASREEMEQALLNAQIEPELRAAILDSDQARLEALLGATANVCCMIHAPEDDEDEPAEDEPADDDGEDPDSQHSALRRVATAG